MLLLFCFIKTNPCYCDCVCPGQMRTMMSHASKDMVCMDAAGGKHEHGDKWTPDDCTVCRCKVRNTTVLVLRVTRAFNVSDFMHMYNYNHVIVMP